MKSLIGIFLPLILMSHFHLFGQCTNESLIQFNVDNSVKVDTTIYWDSLIQVTYSSPDIYGIRRWNKNNNEMRYKFIEYKNPFLRITENFDNNGCVSSLSVSDSINIQTVRFNEKGRLYLYNSSSYQLQKYSEKKEFSFYYKDMFIKVTNYHANGKKNKVGFWNPVKNIYRGMFKMYDDTGKLEEKGKYEIKDEEQIKVGKWVYKEKGKLVKKEFYTQNGALKP